VALRGTLELLGGENWRKLAEKTKPARLETLAPMAGLVARIR